MYLDKYGRSSLDELDPILVRFWDMGLSSEKMTILTSFQQQRDESIINRLTDFRYMINRVGGETE